jgi:hypothetical protein
VSAKAGVADSGFSTSAAWFDYDKDGKLDLLSATILTGRSRKTSSARSTEEQVLLHACVL